MGGLLPVDEDCDGESHDEDEEDHDGDHLVDGDRLWQRTEKLLVTSDTVINIDECVQVKFSELV